MELLPRLARRKGSRDAFDPPLPIRNGRATRSVERADPLSQSRFSADTFTDVSHAATGTPSSGHRSPGRLGRPDGHRESTNPGDSDWTDRACRARAYRPDRESDTAHGGVYSFAGERCPDALFRSLRLAVAEDRKLSSNRELCIERAKCWWHDSSDRENRASGRHEISPEQVLQWSASENWP